MNTEFKLNGSYFSITKNTGTTLKFPLYLKAKTLIAGEIVIQSLFMMS